MANMRGVEVQRHAQSRHQASPRDWHSRTTKLTLNTLPQNYALHRWRRWRGLPMLRAWVPRAGKRAAGWLLPQQPLSQPASPWLHPPHRHLHVLYRDTHIIVTNKAAGVLSQPDKQTDGVATDQLGLVRAHIKDTAGKPGDAYAGLVHRLDRNVTGCIIIALRSKAAARLSYDFKHRLVSKTYVCMVVGKLRGAGMLADSLEHSQENVTRVLGVGVKKEEQRKGAQGEEKEKGAERESEKALLHYKTLGVFHHRQAGAQTLVQIRLVTGKKHQIRAQLSHLGHPIVGDVKYNAPTRFRDKFLALHCCTLSFRHPSVEPLASRDVVKNEKGDGTQKPQRRRMTVHAPLPETWRARFGDEVVWLVEELQRSTDEQQLPRS